MTNWHLIVSEAMLAAAAASMLALVVMVHRRRTVTDSRPFLLLALAVAEWCVASALEVASPNLAAKIAYAKIEYVGIAFVPLAWYLFAAHHASRHASARTQAALAVVPLLTMALAFTNEAHHLIWARVWLAQVSRVPAFAVEHGPWFWVHVIYSYTLLFHGGLFLARTHLRSRRLFTGQTVMMLIALAAPWLANAAYLTGASRSIPFDITPLAFTVTALGMGLSLIRYQLLTIVPVARGRSFESMEDAVLVLDPRDHVVDLNRAAAGILGKPQADVLGLPADRALADLPVLLRRIAGSSSSGEEVAFGDGPRARHYDVRVTELADRGGRPTGRLVVLRDTTARARAEQARSAAYAMSEAVHEASDLPELYHAIHQAIARLMPATNCVIATYDRESDSVSFPYLVDEKLPPLAPRTGGRGLTEYVLHSGRPLLADRQEVLRLLDSGEVVWPKGLSAPQSYLGVPLVGDRGTIGVVAVQSHDGDVTYTTYDVDTLRFVSEQVAMAIQRRAAEDGLRAARGALEDRVEQRTAELAEANSVIRAREERYHLLFDGTSDAVLVHELTTGGSGGAIVEVNQVACVLLGYERDELLGMTVSDTLPPEDRPSLPARCQKLLTEKHAIFEREHLTKSGARVSVEVNAHLFSLGGRPVVMSVARDITERKRLQSQLLYRMELERLVANASARLASLQAEQADAAIEMSLADVGGFGGADRAYVFLVSDDDASMTNTHEWCADGIASQKEFLRDLPSSSLPWWTERVCGLATIDIPSVADMPSEAAAERELLQAQGVRSLLAVPLCRADRAIGFLGFDAVRRAKTWAPEDVRLLHTLADMIAATLERRRAQQALRESEERYRVLFNSLTDAVLVYALGDDGEPPSLITVNDYAGQLTGYDPDELLGMAPAQLYASGGAPLLQEAFARGRRYLFQDAFLTRTDGQVPVEVSVSVFDFGTKPMLLAVARNMTEHQKLQQQLLQAQKMEVVGRLAGGVAHDFNNLLTAIAGHASFTLGAVPEDSPAVEDLTDLLAAVDRARDLTGQLLAFSRRQFIELRLLDLTSLVTDIRKMLARLIGEDVELVTPTGAGRTIIRADRSQIEQVIVNLVVNARDAMPRGGTLTVSAGRAGVYPDEAQRLGVPTGDYATLTVRDTGTGMTEHVKAHLFEPFFTTKEVGRGTGLGLATTYGIVRQHSGYIDVESRPGEGTTFTIYLPLADSGQAVQAAGAKSSRCAPVGGTETVLLVEDDPSVRRVTERMLKSLGYNLLTAEDGPQALTLAGEYQGRIDVLLTDVVLPRMGGSELARAVRLRRPETHVLFVSGYTAGVVSEQGLRDGSIDLLQKPFTEESLALRLREALSREI